MGWFCTFPVVSSAVLITQGQGVCRFLDENVPQHVRKMRGDQSCASLLLCIECCNKCSFVKKNKVRVPMQEGRESANPVYLLQTLAAFNLFRPTIVNVSGANC